MPDLDVKFGLLIPAVPGSYKPSGSVSQKLNITIFPYGQTSSGGKRNPGVLQIAVVDIFPKIENVDGSLSALVFDGEC